MSFSEWKTYKLNDALEALIDYRGKTPKKTTFGVPLVTAKIVKNGFIEKPNEFIAEEDYDSWMVRGFPKVGDVVLTTEAPLGEVAQIKDARIALAQRIVTLRGKKGLLDNSYLKYFLFSKIGQHRLKERETGTTVSGIKQSELRLVEIDCPPYKTQIIIGNILSSLDDAIELNQQINKTLEEMAKAIFKEWFVDFNFPSTSSGQRPNATGKFQETEIGKIPVGWKVATFEDVFDADRGLSYKGAGLAESDATPMHNLNSVLEGGGYKTIGIKYYNGDYKDKHIVNAGEVIVANTEQGHKHLLIGYPAIVPQFYGEHGIFSHHIYRLRPKPNCYLSPDFIFHLLLQTQVREQVIGFANGTTVNMLKIEGLQKPKFAMPPKEIAEKFGAIAKGNRLQAEQNIEENQSLMNLRDTLLPKLMKGEININL